MSEGQFGPTYSLYGVICHAGGGPNSGHYYAMVKGANGMWYEMNDDSVSLHRGTPAVLKNAYILFYIREKGQSLEAAISRPSMTPRNVVSRMKKRKALDSEDDGGDDLGVKTNRPFIGPLLPSPMANDAGVHKKPKTDNRDPQAENIRKKIEAANKVPGTSAALTSLSQYDDDDSESSLATPVDLKPPSSTTESVTAASSPPSCPPTSPPPPNSSATASTSSISSVQSNITPSSGIVPATFYASSNKNDKKRKSPDDDDDEHTPQKHYARVPLHTQPSKQSHGHYRRKSSFGGGAVNPYSRIAGSNTLHRSENHRPMQQYGKKKKRMIM